MNTKPTPHEKIAFAVIDKWLDYRVRHSDLPGLQICIRRKGAIVFSQAYGYANLKTQRKYTTRDLGHIASHSKMFTSCALHMLQAAGALNLMQPAVDFLPELRRHKDKRFKLITIRDLVTNRAGIFRDGVDAGYWDFQKPFPSCAQLIVEVLQAELVYDPNTVSKYSNFGFSLLGLVIEAASGMSYDQFVQSHILDKLPENDILPDYKSVKRLSFADGHSRAFYNDRRLPIKHIPTDAMMAAAGFCASAESISLFLHKLLFTNDFVKNPQRREFLSLTWPIANATEDRYGLGFQFDDFGSLKFGGHTGGYPGFSSQTRNWFGTDYIISFIVNTNIAFSDMILKSVAGIISKVETTIPLVEARGTIVSDVLLDTWFGSIYALGTKRALSFNAESWMACEPCAVFEKQKQGYVSHTENGYYSLGEPMKVFKNSSGKITKIDYGRYELVSESEFLGRGRKMLLA